MEKVNRFYLHQYRFLLQYVEKWKKPILMSTILQKVF